jgi:hypothetical protein
VPRSYWTRRQGRSKLLNIAGTFWTLSSRTVRKSSGPYNTDTFGMQGLKTWKVWSRCASAEAGLVKAL